MSDESPDCLSICPLQLDLLLSEPHEGAGSTGGGIGKGQEQGALLSGGRNWDMVGWGSLSDTLLKSWHDAEPWARS